MSTYMLEGKQMVVNEEELFDLAQRWLPEEEMKDASKKEFAEYVRFLITGTELVEPFYDCDGIEISVEQYYFLACLIYARRNGYESVLECADSKIFNDLESVTEEIYDEFVEKTSDENEEVDNDYFMKWVREEYWDAKEKKMIKCNNREERKTKCITNS